MKNFMPVLSIVFISLFYISNLQAQANSNKSININNSMPNRISMNVTVGKQNMVIALTEGGCLISVPTHKAYEVNATANTMTEISQSEFDKKVSTSKQTTAQGYGERTAQSGQKSSLIGGAIPGGSILSAAVSLAPTSGVSSAASAATSGKVAIWNLKTNETTLQLPDNLPDGDYELTFVVSKPNSDKQASALKTQVRFGLTVQQGILKTKHDTAKNSISNIR